LPSLPRFAARPFLTEILNTPLQRIHNFGYHYGVSLFLKKLCIVRVRLCCAMLCISAACSCAVSVRLSVRPSVTFVYSVETNKHIFKICLPFQFFHSKRYCNILMGTRPQTVASNTVGYRQNSLFWTNMAFGSMTGRVRSTIHGRRSSSRSHLTCPYYYTAAETATHQWTMFIIAPAAWTTIRQRVHWQIRSRSN